MWDYEEMLRAQDGVCAICRQPETFIHPQTGETAFLAVDHCHSTGRIRGLLCRRCNIAIGHLDHNAERLIAAARYLET